MIAVVEADAVEEVIDVFTANGESVALLGEVIPVGRRTSRRL